MQAAHRQKWFSTPRFCWPHPVAAFLFTPWSFRRKGCLSPKPPRASKVFQVPFLCPSEARWQRWACNSGPRPHLCTQKVLEVRVLRMELLCVCGELPLPERDWGRVLATGAESPASCAHPHSSPDSPNTRLWQRLAVCPCRVHLLVLGNSGYLHKNNRQC